MTQPAEHHWAERIRRFREAVGWSQERLAKELGVSHQTVHRWEKSENIPLPKHRGAFIELEKRMLPQTGVDYYIRKRARILTLVDPTGHEAISEERKDIVITAPKIEKFKWEFFTDGRIEKVDISPGIVTPPEIIDNKIYYYQRFKKALITGQALTVECKVFLLDAFLTSHEWTAFDINEPTEYCEITIRFPRERPFKNSSVIAILGDQHLANIGNAVVDESHHEIRWQIKGPVFKASYTVLWDW